MPKPMQFGFQLLQLGRISFILPLGIGRMVLRSKRCCVVLEKRLLPFVEIDDTDAVLVTQLRDWHLID